MIIIGIILLIIFLVEPFINLNTKYGYAGMVIKDNELWMSYYSSHERNKSKHSNVYVQSIKLSSLGL